MPKQQMIDIVKGIAFWALALVWVLILVPFLTDLYYGMTGDYIGWVAYDIIAFLPAFLLVAIGVWLVFLKNK